jgi:hypothetical protein
MSVFYLVILESLFITFHNPTTSKNGLTTMHIDIFVTRSIPKLNGICTIYSV